MLALVICTIDPRIAFETEHRSWVVVVVVLVVMVVFVVVVGVWGCWC